MQIIIGFCTNIINICIGLSVGLSLSVRQCESNIAHLHCQRRTQVWTEIGSRDLSPSLCNVNMLCIIQCSSLLDLESNSIPPSPPSQCK